MASKTKTLFDHATYFVDHPDTDFWSAINQVMPKNVWLDRDASTPEYIQFEVLGDDSATIGVYRIMRPFTGDASTIVLRYANELHTPASKAPADTAAALFRAPHTLHYDRYLGTAFTRA